MKLVDILARELKAWPEGCQCISHDRDIGIFASLYGGGNISLGRISDHNLNDMKVPLVYEGEWRAAVGALNAINGFSGAPEDATHYGHGQTCKFWLKRVDGRWNFINIWGCDIGDWCEASDKDNEWINSREIIARDQSTPEWSEDGLPNVGTKCVIYKGAHEVSDEEARLIGPVVTVTARFKSSRGHEAVAVDGGSDLGCGLFRADMCFHLPTAEEISRREREDAIEEMVAVSPMPSGLSRRVCAALYDANYRKQVTK